MRLYGIVLAKADARATCGTAIETGQGAIREFRPSAPTM